MHSKIIRILIIALLFALTPLMCYAEGSEEYEQLYEMSGAQDMYDRLDSETKERMQQAGITSIGIPSNETGEGVLSTAKEMLKEKFTGPGRTALMILAIIVICRLCNCFENKSIGDTTETVGALACAGVLLPNMISIVGGLEKLATAASVLLTSSVPVYSGLMIAAGNAQTALSHGTMTLAAGNLIPLLAKGLILPAINILLAFAVVATVSSLDLGKISDGIYSFIKWMLVLSVTLFFALIATQTAINVQIDNAAAITAKLVLSSAIPVVGGAIGDSLSAIQGGINIVKSGVGAFGILAALFILLPAMVETFLWIVVCWIGQIVSDLFESKSISKFLTTCLSVLKMLLAVLIIIFVVCAVCASIVILAGGAS